MNTVCVVSTLIRNVQLHAISENGCDKKGDNERRQTNVKLYDIGGDQYLSNNATLAPSLEPSVYSSSYFRKLCLISRNLLLNISGLVDDL